MSIYKRGENWYIDFTFKGQRVRESIGPSRKGAEKVIAKKKAEIAENKYLDKRKDPDPIKFYEFAKEYLGWVKVNHKPSSYPSTISHIKYLDKGFEGKNLQEITTWEIERWKAHRKEKLRPASVNRELAILKHMFGKAIEWGKMKENPAKKVKLLKGVTKRVRYLLPHELQILLSKCGDSLEPIVTLAVHTGMRKGEILSLRWDQVNLEQGIITLRDTKSNETQYVRMDETVRTMLSQMERTEPCIFGGKKNRNAFRVEVDRAFTKAMEGAEIEDFRFHDLRHTFASNLVMQDGVELNDVRELLRHKTMAMTLRYAHLSPKHKEKVICKLDEIFAPMSQNPPHTEKVVSIAR